MKVFLLKLPILICFIVAACGTQDAVELSSGSSPTFKEIQGAPPAEQAPRNADFTVRKIIREGDLYFECRDILETDAFLKNEIRNLKGFIGDESSNRYAERTEKRITIRIPNEQLDPLIQKIQDHAVKIENISIRSEDVTEQYIDVEARLKTKKELEGRYTALLKVAKTVDEILGLERELANVRGEIESMQGRLNYLSDQVSLSTLNVSFYVEGEMAFGFISKLKTGVENGWKNLQWFIVFLVNLWPFFLILVTVIFLILRKKKTPPPPVK